MNILKLTSIELKRFWSKPKNYISVILVIGLSVASSLFINGIFALFIGNSTDVKLNLLSFNQLTNAYSIAFFLALLYYCVGDVSKNLILDYTSNIDQIVFSKPITPSQYAWSKMLYSVFQNLVYGLISAIVIIASAKYYNDGIYSFNDQITSIIHFIIFFVIPLQIVMGLIVSYFSLKLKNKSVLYICNGIFLLMPIAVNGLFAKLDSIYPFLTWLDPTGGLYLNEITKYFTASEINSFTVNNTFILNRVVWVCGTVIACALFIRNFNFEPRMNKEKKLDTTPIQFTPQKPTQHTPTQFGQLMTLLKFNLNNVFRKPGIYILTSVMVGYYSFYAFTNFSVQKTPMYPTTSSVILWVLSASWFYVVIYIGYRLMAIYDEEKTSNTSYTLMSKPLSYLNLYWSKILSIWLEVGFGTGLVAIFAIISQYVFLSPVKSPHLIILNFVIAWFYYLFMIAFSFLIVTIFNQSKMAYIAVLALFASPFVFKGLLNRFDYLQSDMLNNNAEFIVRVNDFAGIGYEADRIVTIRGYWFGMTLVVFVLIGLIALRRDNIKNILLGFIPKTKFFKFLLPLALIISTGFGFLIYAAEKLHPQDSSLKELASVYYSYYADDIPKPIPMITDIDLNYDLYPSQAEYTIKGKYKLVNKNDVSLKEIMVDVYDIEKLKNVSFDVPFEDTKEILEGGMVKYYPSEYGVKKYQFKTPIEPNQEFYMDFEMGYKRNGYGPDDSFGNRTIQKNGTFFENTNLPTIGFNFNKIISENGTAYFSNRFPEVEQYLKGKDLSKNLFSNSSNFVSLKTTVTTDNDQIGVAPGTKTSEEQLPDGRKKYVYQNPKTLFFVNVISSRLNVRTEIANGVKIEIYHHPDHTINLDKIMAGAKDSLKYMIDNYGPYPYEYLRIAEFGSGQYAQSFAGTVSFGEDVFLAKADENNSKKINYPYYITAHEVAHQWWAHQVVPSKGKGSSFLSESLAEYSSNRVIAKNYGENSLLTYKKLNLDTYLKGRKSFASEGDEKPVGEVGYYDNQGFIHYQKGSIVLDNISKVIGEDKLNSVLKNYLSQNLIAPPFADYEVLNKAIIDSVPEDKKQYAIESLNEVAVYDNSITKYSTIEVNGEYVTTIDLNLTKKKVNNSNLESVQFDAQEYTIDSYTNKVSTNINDAEPIKRDIVAVPSGKQQVKIITKTKPDFFVLDKDIMYIDNNLKNNSIGGKPQSFIDLLSDVEALTESLNQK